MIPVSSRIENTAAMGVVQTCDCAAYAKMCSYMIDCVVGGGEESKAKEAGEVARRGGASKHSRSKGMSDSP